MPRRVPAVDVAPAAPPLPIRVIRSPRRRKTAAAKLLPDCIEVRVPAGMTPDAEAEMVASLVARLERKRAAEAGGVNLAERAMKLAHRYGLPLPESVTWAEQNDRWASCTSARGTIRISTRLAGYPPGFSTPSSSTNWPTCLSPTTAPPSGSWPTATLAKSEPRASWRPCRPATPTPATPFEPNRTLNHRGHRPGALIATL